MEIKTVSFVSSRDRGMTPELLEVKKYLVSQRRDLSFRYFTKSDISGNAMNKKAAAGLKKAFCEVPSHMVCVDTSLPEKKSWNKDSARVLIATAYDYQFKNYMEQKNGTKKEALLNFTHIFSGSKFTSEVLKKCYDLTGVKVIDGMCTPLVWQLQQKERQAEIYNKIKFYYPQMEGKKVISIIISENMKPEKILDIEKVLEKAGKDFFILTNSSQLFEMASEISSEYVRTFGYTKTIAAPNELLFISDAIVTNLSNLAVAFAGVKKPLYWIDGSDNAFEQYMKTYYPEMHFSAQTSKKGFMTFDDVQKRFSDYFSNDILKNPVPEIAKLF